MSLKKYSREELEKMPMIELVHLVLMDKKKAVNFYDIHSKVADLKGLTEEQKQEMTGQFYTNLTVDGQVTSVDGGKWGLKRWYPVEQLDLETSVPKKKKKAKKSKKKEEPEEEVKPVIPEDNVEVLTDKFEDEETEDAGDGFDDEDFDDEEDEKDDNKKK